MKFSLCPPMDIVNVTEIKVNAALLACLQPMLAL
jgi:hypothetical protein